MILFLYRVILKPFITKMEHLTQFIFYVIIYVKALFDLPQYLQINIRRILYYLTSGPKWL